MKREDVKRAKELEDLIDGVEKEIQIWEETVRLTSEVRLQGRTSNGITTFPLFLGLDISIIKAVTLDVLNKKIKQYSEELANL